MRSTEYSGSQRPNCRKTGKVTYASGRINAGTYKVDVALKGNYSGSGSKEFSIKKAANPLTVKGRTVKVKYKSVKKKNQTIKAAKAMKVTGAQGNLSYKLVEVTKPKFKKYFKVNAKSGKITVKKKLKKGKYKLKIKVIASGNSNYDASVPATVTITVKVG